MVIEPEPSHAISSAPPGRVTATGEVTKPRRMAATAVAHAPVPHAGVLSQALGDLDVATLARLESDLLQLLKAMGQADDAPARPIG